MKRSFADILQGLDSDRAQKVARKLPEWAAVGAEIPSALALEQCSSSATAGYKAGLAAADVPPEAARMGTVLDLTGGLGVDSWAFSRVAERVVYFERKKELAEAAQRNFERLGAANIEVRCETVTPETELPEADLIYADPARRDAAGRKVFLLEDCTPDILTLLPMLLRKAPTVLLKLSPMADLAMLADRLGSALREIHVVELDGEVKELLCLLHPDSDPAEPEIVLVRLSGQAAADAKLSASRSGELPPETSGTAGPLPTTSSSGPSRSRSHGRLRFCRSTACSGRLSTFSVIGGKGVGGAICGGGAAGRHAAGALRRAAQGGRLPPALRPLGPAETRAVDASVSFFRRAGQWILQGVEGAGRAAVRRRGVQTAETALPQGGCYIP